MNIILASKSKRRKELLKRLKIDFRTINSKYDESKIKSVDMNPKSICKRLAFEKAKTVYSSFNDNLIIGADTVVQINQKILDKPKNKEEAFQHLSMLSGNTHNVYTAVHVLNKNINKNLIDKTKVTFYKLSEDEVNHYIENYNPYDKAGSYGIQDWSSIFVKSIEGCFYNVVGFPLPKFYKLFKHYLCK